MLACHLPLMMTGLHSCLPAAEVGPAVLGTDSAREEFCRRHWSPLCHLARHRGCDSHAAQDVVQDLFAGLVRQGVLDALPQRPLPAQKAFLTLRLRRLLINRWRDARAQRRGGSLEILPLDETTLDEAKTPVQNPPTSAHDRAWLARCIDVAVIRLREQTRAQTWQRIQPALLEDHTPPGQSGAGRTAVHRARKKLRGLVREEMNGSFKDWNDGLLGRQPLES